MQTPRLQDELGPANLRISAEIQRFQNGSAMVHLDVLLAQLIAVGDCLRTLDLKNDPDPASHRSEFRRNLEHLAAVLPSMHDRLLVDRARLERARSHLNGALEWANSFSGRRNGK